MHPRFLTLAEREKIAGLRREGAGFRAIGRALGRPASTVKREVDARSGNGVYRAHAAHRAWTASRPRPKTSKLSQAGPLREFVADGLRRRWSPEQICHALAKEHPDDRSMRVSTETIYQALYVQARGGLRLADLGPRLRDGRAQAVLRRDRGSGLLL
ncbi:transposase [Streptomyces turgidiscabies]